MEVLFLTLKTTWTLLRNRERDEHLMSERKSLTDVAVEVTIMSPPLTTEILCVPLRLAYSPVQAASVVQKSKMHQHLMMNCLWEMRYDFRTCKAYIFLYRQLTVTRNCFQHGYRQIEDKYLELTEARASFHLNYSIIKAMKDTAKQTTPREKKNRES